jgi:hypothetical protein
MLAPDLSISTPRSPEVTDEPGSTSDIIARSDRRASPTRPQAQHGGEPKLLEMLDDPLIQARMARAGVTRETILALMTTVRLPVER